jgi:plasmid stabilization system protein ParE
MQTRTVITLDDAARDLDAGKEFYDLQEEGIGLYYIDSLLSDIESLRIYAGIHSRSLGFYRLLSKRFPFAIYYDISEEFVRVAAVLDMRRNPAWIRQELKERSNQAGDDNSE